MRENFSHKFYVCTCETTNDGQDAERAPVRKKQLRYGTSSAKVAALHRVSSSCYAFREKTFLNSKHRARGVKFGHTTCLSFSRQALSIYSVGQGKRRMSDKYVSFQASLKSSNNKTTYDTSGNEGVLLRYKA